MDQFPLSWQQAILGKPTCCGLLLKQVLSLGYTQAKRMMREKVLDKEFQNEVDHNCEKSFTNFVINPNQYMHMAEATLKYTLG